MKKILALIFAVALMLCAVVSVSAQVSPNPTEPKEEIIVDAIPVPGPDAGSATPEVTNPGKVEVNSGETVTLTATPTQGHKFSHWEYVFGEYEIVEGSLTSPVLVIRPTGSSNIRFEAHFVKEGTDVTEPPSKPIETLPQDPTSPITGTGNNTTEAMSTVIIASAAMAMAIVAVVILKKKTNA